MSQEAKQASMMPPLDNIYTLLDKKNTSDNRLLYSLLRDYEYDYQAPPLSIKYVISGEEHYNLDEHNYIVRPQEFLLINESRYYQVRAHQKGKIDEGICIYLDPKLVVEAWHYQTMKEDKLLDNPNHTGDFYCIEDIYSAKHTELGHFLQELERETRRRRETFNELAYSPDFYYHVASLLCQHQALHLRQIQRLPSLKFSTRKELYRRLRTAKQFIEDNYNQRLEMQEVARIAALSEFHFYRSFRQVYGLSPYQYLLKYRMSKARTLLETSRLSISEVAHLLGFADVQAFNKACRKYLKCSPTTLRRQAKVA